MHDINNILNGDKSLKNLPSLSKTDDNDNKFTLGRNGSLIDLSGVSVTMVMVSNNNTEKGNVDNGEE